MMEYLGLGFIVIFLFLILVFSYLNRRESKFILREIPAYRKLIKELGLAVEGGRKLHLSLGHGGVLDTRAAAGFVGLSLLKRFARTASVSDYPPVVSSGDAMLSILAEDTLETTFKGIGIDDLYDASQNQLTGLTPFSYAAGAMPIIADELVSVDVLAGHFGSEVALLTDAVNQNQGVALGGSDNLSAQAVLYAMLPEPVVGEEYFASGAYIQANHWHRTSLRAQDFLRWIVIVVILLGAILKFMGVL